MSTDTAQAEETRPTNASVGKRLGCTHAHVSRLRYGQRTPSLTLMSRIVRETGWSLTDQVKARESDTYAEEFRRVFELADDRESSE